MQKQNGKYMRKYTNLLLFYNITIKILKKQQRKIINNKKNIQTVVKYY